MSAEPVFKNCNVCGRSLVQEREFYFGMCLICANEEIPTKPKRSSKTKATKKSK